MPDIFGNPTGATAPKPDPIPDVSEGDVVTITTNGYTGFIRSINAGTAWVESDVKKATGFYSLEVLRPGTN